MAAPNFTALSESDQRAVAERLLKIEESGWKPFWCPIPTCDGMPHHKKIAGKDGRLRTQYVSGNDVLGPNKEPLGEREFLTADKRIVRENLSDPEDLEGATLLGRPILDPVWAHNHAREDQRLPPWSEPWTLMVLSGRGAGKTRTGTEFVTLSARKGVDGGIVGRRGTELVNTHVASLIEHAHPEFVPVHWASKDLLEWPNGALTYLFSAERPENIRSVNLSYFWFDEAAWMDEIKSAWANARFAARVKSPGNPIHFLITSTPTPTEWVMEMEEDPDVTVRRVSTYANRANLDAGALAALKKEYEGTRLGRQEIHGEVLRDVEGALWNDDLFKHLSVNALDFISLLETMDDVVVAIDPAGSKGPRSDATGIIACGAQHFDDDGVTRLPSSRFYVLGRATLKGTPTEWAEQAYNIAQLVDANRIIAEKNFGGDMVKQVLQDWAALNPTKSKTLDGDDFRIEVVHAASGASKETRAEPVVGRYEQGLVTHVLSPTKFGDLSELEKQQVTWIPKSRGGRGPSPNDVDALVWAIRALDIHKRYQTSMANQSSVMSKLKPRERR